jgi:ABC-type uncharacterized transport system involved in gliding motility auxiliary subunit
MLTVQYLVLGSTIFFTGIALNTFNIDLNLNLLFIIVIFVNMIFESWSVLTSLLCLLFKSDSLSGKLDPSFEANFEVHNS